MTPDPGAVADALTLLGYNPTALPKLVAHGWESHVFHCVTDVGHLAVRVHSSPSELRANREAEMMRQVGTAGYPVPSVRALTAVGGYPALVMDFIDGPTLERSGWPNRKVADVCLELMAHLHQLSAPAVDDPLEWFRLGCHNIAEHMPRFAPYVSAVLAQQPTEARQAFCHLDFHPANVLWNGSPWVIDWTSGRVTDPRFDFAWTRLLSAMYDPVWLDWLPEVEPWFESAMALRRLATVASMLADGEHAAGDEVTDWAAMRVPADRLQQGTGVVLSDVETFLRG